MYTEADAKKRVALVNEMNGALANLKSAGERMAKAKTTVDAANGEVTVLNVEYADLLAAVMDRSSDPAVRVEKISALNECLERIEAVKKKKHAADSEHGTAKKALTTFEEQLDGLEKSILKLLPAPVRVDHFDRLDAAFADLDAVAAEFVSAQITNEEAQQLVAGTCTRFGPEQVRKLDAYYDSKVRELMQVSARENLSV